MHALKRLAATLLATVVLSGVGLSAATAVPYVEHPREYGPYCKSYVGCSWKGQVRF